MASNLKDLVKKNKKYIKEDINLNELIDKFLLSEQNRKRDRFIPAFHPSLISKGIPCQLWWYFFLNNKEALPEKWKTESLTAMAIGSAIHNEAQHILYRMGILEGVYKCLSCEHEFWATSPKECPNCATTFKKWDYVKFKEVPIHIGFIRGHADGILNQQGKRHLLELKSIKNVDRPNATYGYERLNNKPMDDHFIQTQLYLDCWHEISKKAALGEEYTIDDSGKVSSIKLTSPVYDGARTVGAITHGVIEYLAKNSSEKSSFIVKRNQNSISFLMDEMKLIWKAYLEDNIDALTGVNSFDKGKCKNCPYRNECSWQVC